MSSLFYIVYPRGDRTKLKVVELSETSHEIDDYDVASRCNFYTLEVAERYAQDLAAKHSLQFISTGPAYLD